MSDEERLDLLFKVKDGLMTMEEAMEVVDSGEKPTPTKKKSQSPEGKDKSPPPAAQPSTSPTEANKKSSTAPSRPKPPRAKTESTSSTSSTSSVGGDKKASNAAPTRPPTKPSLSGNVPPRPAAPAPPPPTQSSKGKEEGQQVPSAVAEASSVDQGKSIVEESQWTLEASAEAENGASTEGTVQTTTTGAAPGRRKRREFKN